MSTEKAVNIAVQKATVVKKPNTFCALTKVECILVVNVENWRATRCNSGFYMIL
jgi:hypothetical protein